MTDASRLGSGAVSEPPASALTIAKIVYGLHGFAILVGIAGSATVIGSFVGSVPSIVAVVLNYLKRRDARGTWLESHYRWQIRTFWYAIVWVLIAALLMVTLIGIPIAVAILIGVTIWLVYRIGRGWLRLLDRKPMYD
ncbi:hypothetical protein KJ059_18175 [Myxococcota bacterium]|nr:hypothetical protein [Myxococcota bacterium]MCZ7617028.1 hypothetical protein [Myxococcota bacterium]